MNDPHKDLHESEITTPEEAVELQMRGEVETAKAKRIHPYAHMTGLFKNEAGEWCVRLLFVVDADDEENVFMDIEAQVALSVADDLVYSAQSLLAQQAANGN